MRVDIARWNLHIRPFRSADTAKVRGLLGGILAEYGFSLDIEKTDVDYADIGASYAGGEFWVCIDPAKNGAVVATVAFRPARWTPSDATSVHSEAELRRLYVAADYRRAGLGAFLLAAIEHRAFTAGHTSICLESAAVLKAAAKLYTQFQYQHTTLPCDTYITKRCDVVMRKNLGRHTFREFVAVLDAADPTNVFALVPPKIAERCGVPFKRA